MTAEQSPELPHSSLEALRIHVANSFDWEDLMREALLSHDHNEFTAAVRALAAVSRSPYQFPTPKQQRAALESLAASAPAERPIPPETLTINPNIAGTIDTWHNDNRACLAFLNQERRAIVDLYHRVIGNRLELLVMDSGILEDNCLPIVQHATTTIAGEYMAGLDNLDADWIRDNITASPNSTFIGSYRDLSNLKLSMARHESAAWIQAQLDDLPHWMTVGMPAATVSPHQYATQRTDGTWQTLGDYAIAAEAPRMNRSVNMYANQFGVSSLAHKGYRNIEVAAAVMTHELGHFAHFNRIPLAWLREHWLPATRQEPVHVTDYVASKWLEGNADEAVREDFCDSLKLYRHEPAELMRLSTARMYALNQLIGRYETRHIDSWAATCQTADPQLRRQIRQFFQQVGARWRERQAAQRQP